MKLGIDIQVLFGGARTGLYSLIRQLSAELVLLSNDPVYLIADSSRRLGRLDPWVGRRIARAMVGAQVRIVHQPARFYRLWHRLSICNRVDVLLHNVYGRLPRTWRGANAYLVPDLTALAIDYGKSHRRACLDFYELAATHAHVILVFSEHTKWDFLSRFGGSAERVWVAPLAPGSEFRPGIERRAIEDALRPHALHDTPYVLMVATIEVRKNHATLLRAFDLLRKRDPALRHKLVLVGETWIGHEPVFDLIRELRLEDRVVYLGFFEQLPLLYAGADAFVYPSFYEGFGLPPLEAMASGVPVIVANTSSLPEVVGDAGVLFDPHDVHRLCDALERLLTDRAHHDDFAVRGLKRAAMFSWRRTAEIYLDAFESGFRRFQDGIGRRPWSRALTT